MKRLIYYLAELFYPSKCTLCGKPLPKGQSDLCTKCRTDTAEHPPSPIKFPYIADWRALWYYEGNVRESLLRYKFYGKNAYGKVYGQLLAMKLFREGIQADMITWVPISRRRKRKRGFDQVQLIAKVVSRELGIPLVATLRKVRHTPPQSTLKSIAQRRANILGAYSPVDPQRIAGKQIFLLDDILTTGATASECARTLLTAGAKKIHFAAVAAASHQNMKQ